MKPTTIPPEAKAKIRSTLVTTRSIIFLIQLCAKLTLEHNANVFKYPKQPTSKLLDGLTDTALGGFVRWDAQHFLHITVNGYTYEQSTAFFPFLPLMIRTLSYVISPLVHTVISDDMLALIIYVCFNFVVSLKAAEVLYKLTKEIFGEDTALRSALIYCVNPASIFFAAPYTESLFSFVTLSAIYHCRKFKINSSLRDLLKAIGYIAVSTCVRSNGLLNTGFLCYFYLQIIFQSKIRSVVRDSVTLVLSLIACVLPFVYIQYYFHGRFCGDFENGLPEYITEEADDMGYVMPGEFSLHNQSWCSYKIIPLPYQYVQDVYWNVGFLRYYQLKQIPNFLLALPVIVIMLTGCVRYLRRNKGFLLHLGILRPIVGKDAEIFVCVVHGLLLTVFCVLCVHVQVTTRMIFSATPLIYWFCANLNEKIIRYYCYGYIIVGTFMFATFLPWT